jgi:putative endonuclease
MMSNKFRGTIYVGVTSSIIHRAWQHRTGMMRGFSKKYWLKRLVYVEFHSSISAAIAREKQLKNWKRQWKIELIESTNPEWKDLYREVAYTFM